MTVSIGIALFPGDSAEPDELLRAASTAMNRAKEAGRDGVRFYLPEMQAAAVARMAMERALRRALSEGELALYLQPQCDGTGTIVAAEALLRWPRGDGVVAPPATFVPLAEDCGLIHALGDWVFDEALKMIQHLRRRPECPLGRIAVNVSPRQFRRPDFVAALTRRIAEHGVAPGALELELTEGTVVADFADTARKMNALRRLGVHFSIDDFGTGWSSLSYLKRLPLDALKIDRSFVRDLAHDESDAAIVEAIIAMAHRLGLLVIAEGVDQPSVQALLAARGCDRYQGNLLYAPMPFDRFCDRLPGQPAPFREAE
jgi:EAL domain-containing protein (putative c-di-GMP-specific phosphodiesterase class I)